MVAKRMWALFSGEPAILTHKLLTNKKSKSNLLFKRTGRWQASMVAALVPEIDCCVFNTKIIRLKQSNLFFDWDRCHHLTRC